ncbi:amidohydrolase [Piscinibacter koreensis]|uniref:Amidohydrolase family protein n=1 Tax=Piscinibacter koreensis TaxID=2742824 RepID=A0A7Y6TYD3_9BURK|nr:amidohydrolase family protein [Schlegelella koreensis]NUZ07982.1 amidohydrolase family protein [Schlegelella koreensis]
MDRRIFIRAAAAGAAAVSTLNLASCGGGDHDDSDEGTGPDLLLVNGRIHTMDDQNSVIASIGIHEGRFVAVGDIDRSRAKVIDLGGRTVIPGLVESHTHFVSLANRPGYHVAEWELANDVAGVLEALRVRRQRGVPEGQFITAMGGGTPGMFAERRLPTLAEIDSVVPDRPVFLYQGGGGPARTNTLGKQFFGTATGPLAGPVTVGADGTVAGGNPNMANRALYHLRIRQTFDDKKRSAIDAMTYAASRGITANLDQVLPAKTTGTLDPASLEPQPTDALFNLNHFRMYDALLALHQEKRVFVRLQMNFLHNQGFIPELGDLSKQLPELRERLRNSQPFFGDDMVRTGAIGEWGAPFALPTNANGYAVWYESQRLIARARWSNENAQANNPGIEQVIATYEAMDAEFGIKDLRWGLHHVEQVTPAQLVRLKALNCRVSMSGFKWLGSVPRADGAPIGPPFADIVASGIHAGLHEDGVHIAPLNPWFALHYATTGLNVSGQQINPGQQITRVQALKAYTRDNAWFLKRENDLGSIEVGKLGDFVVLDRDYFTVSDADMRRTNPVLTVVGGKVAYTTGVLA